MTYTFTLPLTGEITIEGSEEDLRVFLLFLRGCIVDAIAYNKDYLHLKGWTQHLFECYECLPEPSPYADPTLDLPF